MTANPYLGELEDCVQKLAENSGDHVICDEQVSKLFELAPQLIASLSNAEKSNLKERARPMCEVSDYFAPANWPTARPQSVEEFETTGLSVEAAAKQQLKRFEQYTSRLVAVGTDKHTRLRLSMRQALRVAAKRLSITFKTPDDLDLIGSLETIKDGIADIATHSWDEEERSKLDAFEEATVRLQSAISDGNGDGYFLLTKIAEGDDRLRTELSVRPDRFKARLNGMLTACKQLTEPDPPQADPTETDGQVETANDPS